MLLECRNHRFILMIGTSKSYSSKNMVHIFSELHLSQKNQYNYYKTFSGSNNHTSGRSNDICCIVHRKCNIQVSKFYKRSYRPMNKVHNIKPCKISLEYTDFRYQNFEGGLVNSSFGSFNSQRD